MSGLRKFALLAGAMLALGLPAGQARATYLVQVTSTLNSASSVSVDGSTVNLASFLDSPSAVFFGTTASPVTQTFGTTMATTTSTTSVSPFSIPVSFSLVFSATSGGTDNHTVTITETGTLSGSVGPNVDTLNFTPSGGAPLQVGSYTALADVGGYTVMARLAPYTPPGTPNTTNVRDFAVQMYAVPEPTTVALLGMGGLMAIAPSLRRLRRQIAKS